MDILTGPAALPLDRRCRFRCGQRILHTLTAGLGQDVQLDPEPAAAGLYRLTPGGRAEAVGAGDAVPGEDLYSRHRCDRSAADDADDHHELGGEG